MTCAGPSTGWRPSIPDGQPLPHEGKAPARLRADVGMAAVGAPPRLLRHWGRVAIAWVPTSEPGAVLFDEPTSARSAANRVVLLADGRSVEDRAPDEFFGDPRNDRARAEDFLSTILKR